MNESRLELPAARWIFLSALVVVSAVFGDVDEGSDGYDDLLLSGRLETIYFHNLTDPIREGLKENSRFYFNNIFINIEGDLGSNSHFIIEFRPLTSDLYLLGGFFTIAEALEGVGDDDDNPRKTRIDNLITKKIRELDAESEKSGFERARVGFYFSDQLGLKMGRVRNPFGFWDDYSIFRNLSALKTDPISLGVALRRRRQQRKPRETAERGVGHCSHARIGQLLWGCVTVGTTIVPRVLGWPPSEADG